MISVFYFIYGLSYFLMGFSILLVVSEKSKFRIAKALPLGIEQKKLRRKKGNSGKNSMNLKDGRS